MNTPSEILTFDDIDSIFLEDEDIINQNIETGKWKLLIIDDEAEVHRVTKLVLNNFKFQEKSLEFISAYSAFDARKLLSIHDDIAVILLDVVMEEDDSGLKLVKYIREQLNNSLIRIILRTGQPGQAPEEKVILDYDINDYKEKTELTIQKLFSTIVTALRTYNHIYTIEKNRKGLNTLVDSFSHIFSLQSTKDFANEVLKQLWSILGIGTQLSQDTTYGLAVVKNTTGFKILSSIGEYGSYLHISKEECIPIEIIDKLNESYIVGKNIYSNQYLVLNIQGINGLQSLIYFYGSFNMGDLDKDLLNVFCSNITALNESIHNSILYKTEKDHRVFTETLYKLNMELTSTLEIREVLVRLLESIQSLVPYDRTAALIEKEKNFEVIINSFEEKLSNYSSVLNSKCYKVISKVARSRMPFLIKNTENFSLFRDPSCLGIESSSLIGVPIIYNMKLFAIIVLRRDISHPFNEQDVDIVKTLANQAGIAIENANLFQKIRNRNSKINNLLNNAGQGFLTFGKNLLVDEEYSSECVNIFGFEIDNYKISDLVFIQEDDKKYLEKILLKLLGNPSKLNIDLYFPLLPTEFRIGSKFIQAEFKLIDWISDDSCEKFMMILTDITERKMLEDKMAEEKLVLKMLSNAYSNEDSMRCQISDFYDFINHNLSELFQSNLPTEDLIYEVFRAIHTFKGIFSQLVMVHTVSTLNDIENTLSEYMKNNEDKNILSFQKLILSFELEKVLDKDLSILTNTLGNKFLNTKRTVSIEENKLLALELQAYSDLSPVNHNEILAKIRHLRYKPFKTILESYIGFVDDSAEKLGKSIHPLSIEGGSFEVDTKCYYNFSKSLVHIFKNILDHGIEYPSERSEACKPEIGTIKCIIEKTENIIGILISDDGRGIDLNQVKQKAIEKNMLSLEQTDKLCEEEAIALVFNNGISTLNSSTEFSGRGIGLSAVKNEIESLNGNIKITTRKGFGTQFHITLPIIE